MEVGWEWLWGLVFPVLLKGLMFKATENNCGVLRYQKAKIKKTKGPK